MLKMQAFEDAMKRRYLEFCSCLERGASDEMEYYRSKILSHIYELLCAAPEGEQILLQLLVNKLADTTRKVASKVHFHCFVSNLSNFIFHLFVFCRRRTC
jgi:ribosome biogenesis protein MAK21